MLHGDQICRQFMYALLMPTSHDPLLANICKVGIHEFLRFMIIFQNGQKKCLMILSFFLINQLDEKSMIMVQWSLTSSCKGNWSSRILSKVLFTIYPKSCTGPTLFMVNANIPKISNNNTELFHIFVTKELFIHKCEGLDIQPAIVFLIGLNMERLCTISTIHRTMDNVLTLKSDILLGLRYLASWCCLCYS